MGSVHRALAFILLGISAILLSGYMFLNNSTINIPSFNMHFVRSLPSGFITKFHKNTNEYITAQMLLNGSFEGDVSIKADHSLITLETYKNKPLRLILNDGQIITKGNITLVNYSGLIQYSPTKLILNGEVKKIILPYTIIDKEKPLTIAYNDTPPSITIDNFYQSKITLNDFNGIIKLYAKGDVISYKVGNKDVFLSDLYVDTLKIKGIKIVLKGEGRIKTNILAIPVE